MTDNPTESTHTKRVKYQNKSEREKKVIKFAENFKKSLVEKK